MVFSNHEIHNAFLVERSKENHDGVLTVGGVPFRVGDQRLSEVAWLSFAMLM